MLPVAARSGLIACADGKSWICACADLELSNGALQLPIQKGGTLAPFA